MTMQENMVL